jgi:hypothetical protein
MLHRVRRLLVRLDHAVLDVATSVVLVAVERAVLRHARRESLR